MDKQNTINNIAQLISQLPLSAEVGSLRELTKNSHENIWQIALTAGSIMNCSLSDEVKQTARNIISLVMTYQGQKALTSLTPTKVVFGTSGWREPIGDCFTVENVHKVVRAITTMLKTPTFLKTSKYKNFSEVQKAGILLLRDNRFLGDTFIDAAKLELAREGIKIFVAGMCPTGVGSAVLTELGGAGSINFTPSHNSMEYSGLKFNPRDGGPADPSLTTLIEEYANTLMIPGAEFTKSNIDCTPFVTNIDAADIFINFIQKKSKVFDLGALRTWLKKEKNNISIVIDTMHGSVRGYIQSVFGASLTEELQKSGSLTLLHLADDYSFHGVKPEPSAKNQRELISLLQTSSRALTLACAMDPDADRIRFADKNMDIDMNRFSAIAYANLLERGIKGGIASTVPSSGFAMEIARANGEKVFEEAVGFKNFRGHLSSGEAVMAYEESDGISVKGHTLEKCAIAGFLLALNAMSTHNKNLSEQFNSLQKKYGYFYPDKSGQDITGQSVEGWEKYKHAIGEVLEHKLLKGGDAVKIGEETKTIKSVNIVDGLKIIFEDRSWILLRASGTEPKFRYYYELASQVPIDAVDAKLEGYKTLAEQILKKAQALVK